MRNCKSLQVGINFIMNLFIVCRCCTHVPESVRVYVISRNTFMRQRDISAGKNVETEKREKERELSTRKKQSLI